MTPLHYKENCQASANWWNANQMCHDMGMRLCKLSEMDDDKCCVTGCMFDVDKVWTSTSEPVYRLHQKNETGDSCNYKSDISGTSTDQVGVVCCGPDSVCVDPVANVATSATIEQAHVMCNALGLEVCRDSRLCSRCKNTQAYLDGLLIIGTKTYVSR